MITDYFILIIPGLVGGIAVAIGNIIYYKYTSSKEKNIEFLKMQITELLLPLYVEFKNMDFSGRTLGGHPALEKYGNENIIDDIITKKIWLASPKLSNLLMEYLYSEYLWDVRRDDEPLINIYEELEQTIFEEYEQRVREYHKLYGKK